MKKLNRREQAMALMITLSLPLVYMTVLAPQQSKKIAALKTTVETTSAKVATDEATLSSLMTKVAGSKRSVDTNDEVQRYIEANRHMSNILRKLGADEKERGMMLKNITVEQSKKLNNFYQTTMKVEVESSFVALGNFLGALSDSETLIDVKTVSLNRIDSDLKKCTAVIEVNGYFNEGPKL